MKLLVINRLHQLNWWGTDKKLILCNNAPAKFGSVMIIKKGEFQMMNLTQFPRGLRDHYLATGLLVLISGFSQALVAATMVVNSLEDTVLADGQCTLREALDNANQDTAGIGDCLAGSGDDVIDLTGLNGTIILSSELKITSNLRVEGPGAEELTISGDSKYRVFWVNSGTTVEIKGVKISNGCEEYYGSGGILNWGTLTVTDSILSENKDSGISNAGTLTLINSQVLKTYTDKYQSIGVSNWGTLTVINSTVSENEGIGIDNEDTLTLNNSTISGNKGDGISYIESPGPASITNSTISKNGGNGINTEDLTLINSTVSENGSIGIEARGLITISDSVVSENGDSGIINGGTTLTMTNSTVLKNHGGGIFSGSTILTMTNSTVSGNSSGGGISNFSGKATLINTTVSGNSTKYGGGGILNEYEGTLTLINTTVSGNSAESGGGILNFSGKATLINTTVSGNSAKYSGGGILNEADSTLTLINSTISENISEDNPDDPWDGGGGIYNGGTLNLKNTLIANNTNGDCYNSEWSTIGTNLNNFIGDGSCNPTFSGDPKLGPLANNGGPTFTHALLRGSPAIDVGDDATCAVEPVNGLDQRGVARFGSLAGNHCDIGAYEYQKPALATLGSFTIDSNAIRWETLAEQGTQGFYLWQAEPVVAGTCEAFINPQLVIPNPIPAKGSEV